MNTPTVSRETLVWWTTDDAAAVDDGRRTTDDGQQATEFDVLEMALLDLRSGRMAPFVADLDAEDLPDFHGAGYEDEIGYDESRHPWRY